MRGAGVILAVAGGLTSGLAGAVGFGAGRMTATGLGGGIAGRGAKTGAGEGGATGGGSLGGARVSGGRRPPLGRRGVGVPPTPARRQWARQRSAARSAAGAPHRSAKAGDSGSTSSRPGCRAAARRAGRALAAAPAPAGWYPPRRERCHSSGVGDRQRRICRSMAVINSPPMSSPNWASSSRAQVGLVTLISVR